MLGFPSTPDDEKMKWSGSHAEFIALVELFEAIGAFKFKEEGRSATIDEIGELFLKVFDLDLSPYPDFRSMRLSVSPIVSPEETAQKVMNRLEEEHHLEQALEGTKVEPSDEEKATQLASWMFAEDLIKKLSKHINIPKDKE